MFYRFIKFIIPAKGMYAYQNNGTDYLLLLYILFMKSQIELYIVREILTRRKKHKYSQQYIADCLNVSRSFIKNIENLNDSTAYNIDHLNELAKVFECSPKDFWPTNPL